MKSTAKGRWIGDVIRLFDANVSPSQKTCAHGANHLE